MYLYNTHFGNSRPDL